MTTKAQLGVTIKVRADTSAKQKVKVAAAYQYAADNADDAAEARAAADAATADAATAASAVTADPTATAADTELL